MSTHAVIHATRQTNHGTAPAHYSLTAEERTADYELVEIDRSVVTHLHSGGVVTRRQISVPVDITSDLVRVQGSNRLYGWSFAAGTGRPNLQLPKGGSIERHDTTAPAPPDDYLEQFVACWSTPGANPESRFRFRAPQPLLAKVSIGDTEYALQRNTDDATSVSWGNVDFDTYGLATSETERDPLGFTSTESTVEEVQFFDGEDNPLFTRPGAIIGSEEATHHDSKDEQVVVRRSELVDAISRRLIFGVPLVFRLGIAVTGDQSLSFERYLHKIWSLLHDVDGALNDDTIYAAINGMLDLDVVRFMSALVTTDLLSAGSWGSELADTDRSAYLLDLSGSTASTTVIQDSGSNAVRLPDDWHASVPAWRLP